MKPRGEWEIVKGSPKQSTRSLTMYRPDLAQSRAFERNAINFFRTKLRPFLSGRGMEVDRGKHFSLLFPI